MSETQYTDSDGLLEDYSANEIDQANMRIRAQENAIADLRTSYDNLNAEYANLNNRYNDCAGQVGIDADRLSQTEALLGLARDDNDYLARSLAHAKSERDLWHTRAEGCMAEKDGLLALLDEARTAAPTNASSHTDEDWETISECAKALMQMVDLFMRNIKPGMSEKAVAMMQAQAVAALMPVRAKLPD